MFNFSFQPAGATAPTAPSRGFNANDFFGNAKNFFGGAAPAPTDPFSSGKTLFGFGAAQPDVFSSAQAQAPFASGAAPPFAGAPAVPAAAGAGLFSTGGGPFGGGAPDVGAGLLGSLGGGGPFGSASPPSATAQAPFNFTIGPVDVPRPEAGSGTVSSGMGVPRTAYAAPAVPSPVDPSCAPPPAVACPVVRGRDGLLRKQRTLANGVTQEPCGCTQQLDSCIAQCRHEVQAIAEKCRQRQEKYVDLDFKADSRSLFANGQSPSKRFPGKSMPASWGRASEVFSTRRDSGSSSNWLLGQVIGQSKPGEDKHQVFIPGPMGGAYFLSALAALGTIGVDPRELIVWHDAVAGVYGVRIFKDGEWLYEILDDYLPLDQQRQLACSRAFRGTESEDWLCLLEKAYAKIHGCYESIAVGLEAEALEDVLGMGSHRIIIMCDFPIWGELWRHLRSKRRRGYAMLATCNSCVQNPGEVLESGLVSGCAYPIGRLEMMHGECLVELENPWAAGAWAGRWGSNSVEVRSVLPHEARMLEPAHEGIRSFWMSIQDFCKHFTDVVEARSVSPYWQCAVVTSSTDRPSIPLMSVPQPTQALFVLSQVDTRLAGHGHEDYRNSVGLRIYRCRIVAPSQQMTGAKQNVSNPFKNLELVASCQLTRAHSAVVEIAHLEPSCLYIAHIDSEYRSANLLLKVFTACAPKFRELTSPEKQHFLTSQASAPSVPDSDSFSSQEA